MQRVLAGWTGPEYEFNAVFPRGQMQSPKIRAFVDFLVERINFEADYMKALCPDSARCTESMGKVAGAVVAEIARAAEKPAVKPRSGAKRADPEIAEPV